MMEKKKRFTHEYMIDQKENLKRSAGYMIRIRS